MVPLESGSFSDQCCESIACMTETKVVCIVNSCSHLLLLNIAGTDCGGGRMWCEQY